jgi:ribonuclease III
MKKKKMKIDDLEKKLSLNFSDKDLLKKSLTHRSFLNENKDVDLKHNERLEFLEMQF